MDGELKFLLTVLQIATCNHDFGPAPAPNNSQPVQESAKWKLKVSLAVIIGKLQYQ